MARDHVAIQEAQREAWRKVRARISAIREDMVEEDFRMGAGQDVIDDCLTFLFKQRRYEAAREYLSLLVELDRANWVIEHPESDSVDAPAYMRTEE